MKMLVNGEETSMDEVLKSGLSKDNMLPSSSLSHVYPIDLTLEEMEDAILLQRLVCCDGSREATAKSLGVNRKWVSTRITRLRVSNKYSGPYKSVLEKRPGINRIHKPVDWRTE